MTNGDRATPATVTWIRDNPETFGDWLRDQRWFGDKSRELASIDPRAIASVEIDGSPVELLSVRCEFTDRSRSDYFVPLIQQGAGRPTDALGDPAFRAWLAAGFPERRRLTADDSRIAWEPLEADSDTDWATGTGEVLTGEQSNTSINFGDQAIVKVFRKLQPGVNPDSEIVAFLTAHTDYRHVPRFLGGIVLKSDDEHEDVELAAVQGFVPNQGDCWKWLPGALTGASRDALDALLEPVGLLGRRTGELHAALASSDNVDAFRPEPFETRDVGAEEERLGVELDTTFSMLRRKGVMPESEVDALAGDLKERVGHAGALEGLPRTRVHGDYHLGQVLRSGDDFVIIDFEGEPSRPMHERRQKHSPLKDVAGMLRSLDYAVSTAKQEAGVQPRNDLDDWSRAAETRFLRDYRDAVRDARVPLVPSDEATFADALDLYVIEKALYETRYELDNRPEWVGIPLGGLRRIAERA